MRAVLRQPANRTDYMSGAQHHRDFDSSTRNFCIELDLFSSKQQSYSAAATYSNVLDWEDGRETRDVEGGFPATTYQALARNRIPSKETVIFLR